MLRTLRWRTVFYLCIFLSVYGVSRAQTVTLSGQVVDEKNQPVPYASVVISTDSLSQKDVLYAVTSDDGRFVIDKISAEPNRRWLRVRSMGYSAHCERIALNTIKTSLSITLMEEAFEVGEVAITARVSDVYTKGDTLVFSSNNYIIGNERNLGDVIKKMPGMEVDDKGNVTYQGKRIKKILVDGQDILASSSGVAMNTLPPDFAGSVELLANYTDGDIAHAFRAGEQLALNLKSSKKATLSGSIEGGGGIMDKFVAKSSLISILPKTSVSAIVNANNTGEAVFSIEDYVSNIIDIEALRSGSSSMTSFSLSSEEQQLLLPPTNEHARTAGLANVNITWSPNSKYRLRSNTLFNKGKSEGSHMRTDAYTLPDNSFTNISTGYVRKNTQFISQYLTQRWMPSHSFSVNAGTKLDIRNYEALNLHANKFDNTGINAMEKPRNRFEGLRQDVEMKWLLGRGLVFGGGNLDLGNGKTNSDIYIDTLLLPLPFENVNIEYPYLYESEKKNTGAGLNLYAGVMYPILKNIHLKGEFSYSLRSDRLVVAHQDENPNEETFDLIASNPRIGLMKNKGLLRFDVGVSFSSYKQKMYPSVLSVNTIFHIEPYASLELVMSNQHRLTLSASESVSPLPVEYLSRQVWADGYDYLRLASTVSDPFAKRFESSLSYIYLSLFNHLSMYGIVSYIGDRDCQTAVTTSKGLLTNTFYRGGGRNDVLTSRLYISKGIGSLPLDVKISGAYTFIEYNLVRIDETDVLNNKSIDAKLDFVSRLNRSPINFEVGLRFNRLDQKFTHSNIFLYNRELEGIATLHLSVGNVLLSVSGKSSRIEDEEVKRSFGDLDFSLRYRLNKFDIKLTGENVFHLRGNEWIKKILSPTVQSTVLYRRLSGYVVLSLSYKL